MKIEPLADRTNGEGVASVFFSSNFCPTPEFEQLFEWVRLGAANIRKNTACVEAHRQSLRARGESEKRLNASDHWRESLAFTEQEKTALGLSEAISLHEPGELAAEILKAQYHFSTHQIVRLTLTVIAVNDWIDFHAKSPDRILVVEDNPWDQELLLRHLRKTQMAENVLFAADGLQALELIEDSIRSAWGFIVAFLDINLPDMSGVELLQRIRTMPGMQYLPVIAMTSSNTPADLESCQKLGVSGYMQKPITSSTFTKALGDALPQSRQGEGSVQPIVRPDQRSANVKIPA
jgi:AhpD family alkylhydroperoxidase